MFNGILFNLGKEKTSELCYKIDESFEHYSK
jgi:hypothetical protein